MGYQLDPHSGVHRSAYPMSIDNDDWNVDQNVNR